ncbi:hypothetical protein GURASL_29710 [Geotalea uraniireducens]|uniref:Uncharacterized protein n=1 Tax=Geotalea uraniireducens TaxID=351604 RepID=A0ABN6VUL9_9BACT|nr:hypothetical protein [Geotalea uraniireducens]BDV44048.1 hypothetical protein GURASL_29710 [Geotalea uraniireducens]
MDLSLSQEVPLFHGSRADFYRFNPLYIGTGENAGPGVGFHFTDSLKGAAAHAKGYVRGDGEPLVYVCRAVTGSNVIRRGIAPAKHPPVIQKIWNEKLPVACSRLFSALNWFDELENYFSPILVADCPSDNSEAKKCHFLQQCGIDFITNYEAGWQDAYLHGDVILLLNPNMVEIIECLRADEICAETIGDPKKYLLSNSQLLLGDTNVLSYLRRATGRQLGQWSGEPIHRPAVDW